MRYLKLALVAVFLASALPSQAQPQAPEIKAQQKPEKSLPAEKESPKAIPLKDEGGDEKHEGGGETATQIAVLGVKVSLGELLLFLATLGLWASTQFLVREAKASSARQLRAYVDVEYGRITSTPQGTWRMEVCIKNYGQTPANLISCKMDKFIGAKRDTGTLMPLPAAPNAAIGARIPPHHFHTLTLTCPEIGNGNAGWQAKNATDEEAYFWGRLEYKDAFGKCWYLHFQLMNEFGEASSMSFADGGNDSGPIRRGLYGWVREKVCG